MTLHVNEVKDVSPKAVRKAVVGAASQRPLTIYPAVVAMLGGAFALLVDANIFSLGALAIGSGITAINWGWEFFARGGKHATHFIQQCREEIAQRRRAALQDVESSLREIHSAQGLKQLELFKSKYANFVAVLERKLESNELTFHRYLTIAEQVYLGGLDNLENAALAMKSVSAIDVDHVQKELQRLHDQHTDAAKKQVEQLRTRMHLKESQSLRASALLLENEQALTQLDHVAAKISAIQTRQGRAQVDLDDAMLELQRLITRTEDYSQ